MTIPVKVRTIVSLVLGFALVGVTATVALAWNANCSDSGDACVWRHASFGVPLAAKDISDSNYTDDFFPNTQTTLNDQVSSIRNKFNVKDVVYYFDHGYAGTSFCLKAGSQSGDLNTHNDEYSSHLVATGSTC